MVTRVGISAAQLIENHPRLYHMAQEGSWESIKKYGLLSTSALLDLYEIAGRERFALESEHRPESKIVDHDVLGIAVIRDQKAIRESSLRQCLIGLTPKQWYELLNSKVFFWLTRERLLRLLSARAYRDDTHCIITVDTALLVGRYLERIRLSPINSGSTLFNPRPRGGATFLTVDEYPFEARTKQRGRGDAIAELSIDHSVPDIAEFVTRVAHMHGSREVEIIYER